MTVSNDCIVYLEKPINIGDSSYYIFRCDPVPFGGRNGFTLLGQDPNNDFEIVVNDNQIAHILYEVDVGNSANFSTLASSLKLEGFIDIS